MKKCDFDYCRACPKLFVLIISIFLSSTVNSQHFQYPFTRKQLFMDTVFGKVVVDNYRWMENIKSLEMQEWLQAQTNFTNGFLDKIPGRDKLLATYQSLDSLKTESITGLVQKGNRYFYRKTLPGENTGKLFYRNGLNGKEILLFDPLIYNPGTKLSFTFLPSNDGKKVACSFSEQGKELFVDRILNVENKSFYPETIIPGSIYGGFGRTWTPDDKAIVMTVPNDTNHLSKDYYRNVKLKYHQIGTDPKNDITVLAADQYNSLDIQPDAPDLLQSNKKWKTLITPADQVIEGNIFNETLFFLTRKENPNGKLQTVSLKNLDFGKAKTIMPAGDSTITAWYISKDYFFVIKTKEKKPTVYQVNRKTGVSKTVALPFYGNAWFSNGMFNENKMMINGGSWKEQLVRYHYDGNNQRLLYSSLNRSVKYPGLDDLILEELEVTGHDGVNVPLSLIHNKKLVKGGSNIIYMIGYGAYGIESSPYVGINLLPLLNKGIIMAFAHTRGGGEKGEAWHKEGMKSKKPNTWKDFISCAEYLINEGYTTPGKLIGEGGSAGGILIGRAITERPDLFGASVHVVPVSNAVRHVTGSTIGANDAKEFGSITDPAEAIGLLEMDVYQHIVSNVKYPAVLATVGINDGRVPAWEAGKMIAAMQQASASGKPVFLQVNYNSGHNSSDKSVQFKALTDKFAFALWQVGHKDFQINRN